jgi:hypothetical protein
MDDVHVEEGEVLVHMRKRFREAQGHSGELEELGSAT